jgi:DNA-binding transcriptional LysR family regulator
MLDELRHLLAIAEHGTFTAAARAAHLSQPALSAAIHRLEEAVGARLFHRGRAGASLTAAGQALVPHALAALAAFTDGRRAVAEIEGLAAGTVRIGGGATVCTYFLPHHLARFRNLYPGLRFQVREAYPDGIRAAVDAGDIDLGVASGPGDDHWMWDELILVAAPGAPRQLGADARFVAFTEGSATRALLLHHLPDADIVMELASIATVKGNVQAGMGVALLSRAAVAADLAARRLIEVRSSVTPIVRELSLLHRGHSRLPPAAAALRQLLLDDANRNAPRRRGQAKSRRYPSSSRRRR